MRSLLATSTLLLLAIAGLAITTLLREPALHQGDPNPVIYPGREPQVMAFLAPILTGGFAGRHVTDVEVARDTLHVVLDPAPCGAQFVDVGYHPFDPDTDATTGDPASGAVTRRGLHVHWSVCDAHADTTAIARTLAQSLAARFHPGLWGHMGDPPPGTPERIGMLTPVAWALHLRGAWIVVLAFLVTFALAALLASRGDPVPPVMLPYERHSRLALGVLAAVLLAGGALRIHAALTLPIDGDESWALPSPHGILADDHDARAHPPLFRALQTGWVHVMPHADLEHPGRLRAPSLCFALLALAFAVAACAHARTSPALLVGLSGFALAAVPMVLARPYGLAVLLVTLAAVACWTPSRSEDHGTEGWRWGVALVALALAAWTDLFAGLAVAAVMAAPVVAGSVRRTMAWPVAGIALLSVLPLVPGAWQAAHADVHPVVSANAEVRGGPDLRPTVSPPRFARDLVAFELTGSMDRGTGAVLLFAVVLAAAVLVARMGGARPDLVPLYTVLALDVVLAIAAARIGIRARNVAFMPGLMSLAVMSLGARREG